MKTGQSDMVQTVSCHTEGAINALALNRDGTHLVVAGRNVFKIYLIEDNKFEERNNLRVGRHLNLNFSASDVSWNQMEDHMLASAATNGAVVIWDLNRLSKSKQEHVFQEHRRTVNRVNFHETEANWLISGSQDGSMKLFDIRRRTVSTTFSTGSTSIRDVQFCPSNLGYFAFGAADESGNVQLWDMRRPDKVEKQITAHSGPVFTIDWHPEDKNWLGTAGRDKMIKVWDLQKDKVIYLVQTIASVAQIRWRPNRRFHIASCSLLVDSSINVWDIRRPYIPFATFEEHKDVATGIVWKKDDPHVFFSSGKDSFLYQHIFHDAKRPADHTVPAGIDMSIMGDISFAYSDKPGITGKSKSSERRSLFRKLPDRSIQFTLVNSLMYMFSNWDESVSMEWFVVSAKEYQLKGRPVQELCEHNATVAEKLDRHQVAQSWRMLKNLYGTTITSSHPQLHQARTVSMVSTSSERQETEKAKVVKSSKDISIENVEPHQKKEQSTIEVTSGCSDDESDKELNDQSLSNIARGQINPPAEWDIFFGDGDPTGIEYDTMANINSNINYWSALPNEAFMPRHEITEGATPIETIPNGHESPTSAQESDMNNASVAQGAPPEPDSEDVLPTNLAYPDLQLPNWSFTSIVTEMMKFFAEQGDVQTPTSMLIILGDRIRSHVEEQMQENWFLSYIDLLGRFKLWTIANEIIKLCHLPPVSILNQQSTTVHTNCNKCTRPLQRSSWLCDRCKMITNVCSICHYPVKSLFVWCQGCSHGGHLQHIKEWLEINDQCPAGCGHLCEYT